MSGTDTRLADGKRYRWTVEGVGNSQGHFVPDHVDQAAYPGASSVLIVAAYSASKIELLPDPLPDAVDSVILLVRDNPVDTSNRQRISFQLDEDGWSSRSWRDPWTTETLQAEVGGRLNGELIVLFDANETEPQ